MVARSSCCSSDLGKLSFKRGVNGLADPRGRGEGGVALGMRWVMRVRRVRSDEEGRVEREHERLREEPHLRDSPEKGGHRIGYLIVVVHRSPA